MLKTAAIIATAVVALSGTAVAHAHGRDDHRADRHAANAHYHTGDRRFERRVVRRADRRAQRRHWRQDRWIAEHRRFLYDGRSFRHRHGRVGWHWHRAPRYRSPVVGHVCDLDGRCYVQHGGKIIYRLRP